MKVWDIIPFSQEKNIGKAYNETMALIPDDDWCCLRDADTQFLTPDYGNILHEYAKRNPDAALLTSFTNRVSPLSKWQLLNGQLNNNSDIRFHLQIAEKQKKYLYQTTEIKGTISGMLMLISKKAWQENNFCDNGQLLGVDTEYSRRLLAQGKIMLRMDGFFIFHSYRFINGIHSKNHLKV